ncbi:hypothetical protein RIF29_21695 [Crotalaria pallida]|uniref:Uncharacterized protein n=1 Tax=Crotalaria pallida TaxID=3830 RepID=A0AAN9F351_CROPI
MSCEFVGRGIKVVLKQFGVGGYEGSDNMVTDEAELQHHQKLEKLCVSTRTGKHYQRDIVRGVEGYIVMISHKDSLGDVHGLLSSQFGLLYASSWLEGKVLPPSSVRT